MSDVFVNLCLCLSHSVCVCIFRLKTWSHGVGFERGFSLTTDIGIRPCLSHSFLLCFSFLCFALSLQSLCVLSLLFRPRTLDAPSLSRIQTRALTLSVGTDSHSLYGGKLSRHLQRLLNLFHRPTHAHIVQSLLPTGLLVWTLYKRDSYKSFFLHPHFSASPPCFRRNFFFFTFSFFLQSISAHILSCIVSVFAPNTLGFCSSLGFAITPRTLTPTGGQTSNLYAVSCTPCEIKGRGGRTETWVVLVHQRKA